MRIKRKHVYQQDSRLCGPTCLASIFASYDTSVPIDEINKQAGGSIRGTTLLGLKQAAEYFGLEAEGYEATMNSLSECKDICILHIIKDNRLQHFVIYWGYDEKRKKFIIGDPAEKQNTYWTEEDLEEVWKSKALLLLRPTARLKKQKEQKISKWSWIKQLVREDLNILTMAMVLGMVVAILGLSTAIFLQKLLDDILPSEDTSRLFSGIGLLAFLLLAKSIANYIRQFFLLRQSRDFNIRVIIPDALQFELFLKTKKGHLCVKKPRRSAAMPTFLALI